MAGRSLLARFSWRGSALTSSARMAHSDASSTYSKDTETHFGFQTVNEEVKRQKVLEVFHNVADSYDLMNDAMSFGIHHLWKDAFVSELNPGKDIKLLDVAGGTGDIVFRVLDRIRADAGASYHITCCDINESMLKVGEARAVNRGYKPNDICWTVGDAQDLHGFADNSFDAYTISFGIRNVVNVQRALDEAYRVLKPGGRFLCLEFSRVNSDLIRAVYDFYSFQVIPPMGKVLAGDWDSYQYLVESIRRFPSQLQFEKMIRSAGFKFVTHQNLTFGVAAIHSGFKL